MDNHSPSAGQSSLAEEAKSRIEALSKQLDDLRGQLEDERERRIDLETELQKQERHREKLERKIDRLEDRTDMLDLAKNANSLDGEQRSLALIQHLRQKALSRRERGEPEKAAVTRDEAEEALHYPDIHRTTLYDDMNRAAELVDDRRLLRYEGGELRLDLEKGTLPGRVTEDEEV